MAEVDDTNCSRKVTASTNSELESDIEQEKEKNVCMTKASRKEEIVKYYNNEENNEETVFSTNKEEKRVTRSKRNINSNLESHIGKDKEKEERIEDDIIKASLSEEISYSDENEAQEKANFINEDKLENECLFLKSKKKENNFSVAENEEQLEETSSQQKNIGVTSHNEKMINIETNNLFAKDENKKKLINTKETIDFENEDQRMKLYQNEDEEIVSVTEKEDDLDDGISETSQNEEISNSKSDRSEDKEKINSVNDERELESTLTKSEKKEKENVSNTEREKQNENNSQQEEIDVVRANHNEKITNIQTDQLDKKDNKEMIIITKEEDEGTASVSKAEVKNEENLKDAIKKITRDEEISNCKHNEIEDQEKINSINESKLENKSIFTKEENMSISEREQKNEESNIQQEDTCPTKANRNEEIINIQTNQLGNEENKEMTITTKETEIENEDRTTKTYQYEGADVTKNDHKNEESLEDIITQPGQNVENFNYKLDECKVKEKTSFVNEKSTLENKSGLISDIEKEDQNEVKCITSASQEKDCVNLNNYVATFVNIDDSVSRTNNCNNQTDDSIEKEDYEEKKTEEKDEKEATSSNERKLQDNLYFEDNTSAEPKETTTTDNTKDFENDEDKIVIRCQKKEEEDEDDYNDEMRFTRNTGQKEDCINLEDNSTEDSQSEEMSYLQYDMKEEAISTNKMEDTTTDKKSTKCDNQLKDVIITIEEDIKDEELKSAETILYNSKLQFNIMANKSNFEPRPTNPENERIDRDDLYSELKSKLTKMSRSLEHGLKSAEKDPHRQYSLISSAQKQLEQIKNMKKQLAVPYQSKLQDRIDNFIERFKDCGFGKQVEMDCFSSEGKNYCEMQVTSAGSWRQPKELYGDRDQLERRFQKLNTKSESLSVEQGTDCNISQHSQKATSMPPETIYSNETPKKDQNKYSNIPKIHSYTASTVTTSYQRTSERMANTDSTVTQLDQACQTSFCEEHKSPPRPKLAVDKEHPNADIARNMRNSSPKKEVQNETSSYSMLKSNREMRDNPSCQRAYGRIAQSVYEQNKNVKPFQTVSPTNSEMKDLKSYSKSSNFDKTPEVTRNLRSVRTKSQSDMESTESNTPLTANTQTQHILIRQQHLLQDNGEKVKYCNQSKGNSRSRHEEKMDLQDRKPEREERSKEQTERRGTTDLEYTTGEAFIQKFQQQREEERQRKIVSLEHHKQQLEEHEKRIVEKMYMDNYNTRLSGATLEPRESEKDINSRSHPRSIDDKRISPQIQLAHTYKKNYLEDSSSPDFDKGAVSYHRYQHRKSPEIVNMSSYQQQRNHLSFVNEHENVGRKQQITPSTSSRNYHYKEQECQDPHARTFSNEEKIMREKQFQVSRQQYPEEDSYGDSNNQRYSYEEQRYMQEGNYQQEHQKRSLENYHFPQRRTLHEGPEMMRRQQIEVAEEVEEEPLEIIDVQQYFTGDYDLKTLDDSVDIKTQIETVEKWAQTFDDKVNTFSGEKFSLEYFVLDEKLMRLIEHLDKLKCHEDQATTARKIEVIQYIKRLHSILDSNAKDE